MLESPAMITLPSMSSLLSVKAGYFPITSPPGFSASLYVLPPSLSTTVSFAVMSDGKRTTSRTADFSFAFASFSSTVCLSLLSLSSSASSFTILAISSVFSGSSLSCRAFRTHILHMNSVIPASSTLSNLVSSMSTDFLQSSHCTCVPFFCPSSSPPSTPFFSPFSSLSPSLASFISTSILSRASRSFPSSLLIISNIPFISSAFTQIRHWYSLSAASSTLPNGASMRKHHRSQLPPATLGTSGLALSGLALSGFFRELHWPRLSSFAWLLESRAAHARGAVTSHGAQLAHRSRRRRALLAGLRIPEE
ncbi:unnamed protein product [Ixodes persulcatus]